MLKTTPKEHGQYMVHFGGRTFLRGTVGRAVDQTQHFAGIGNVSPQLALATRSNPDGDPPRFALVESLCRGLSLPRPTGHAAADGSGPSPRRPEFDARFGLGWGLFHSEERRQMSRAANARPGGFFTEMLRRCRWADHALERLDGNPDNESRPI